MDDCALETVGLGRRYRRGWALRGCDLRLPAGRVAALVGPNAAGKSTLMAMAAGLVRPTEGTVRVLGEERGRHGAHPRLAFLAQDRPLYHGFTVAEMLHAGQAMNPSFDRPYALRLVEEAAVPLKARVSTLSGGQRSRVALALALGRRPSMIMLDEPLSDLDPLARQEVMQVVMAEVADSGMTVLLSSHVLADLEGICDHLILLAGGHVQLAGDVDALLGRHRLLVGPSGPLPFRADDVVETRTTQRQATVLVRTASPFAPPGWESIEPSLEELTLAHLRIARSGRAVAA